MFDSPETVFTAVRSGFQSKPILVVGDLMLDRYIWGDVNRISPEAPVPVVRIAKQTEAAGGAANVALNLIGLGLPVSLSGFIGVDEGAGKLLALLDEADIDISNITTAESHPTTLKTRIIGGHQQMLRLDVESLAPYQPEELDRLLAALLPRINAGDFAAIVLSDYAKGVLPHRVCEAIIHEAWMRMTPVIVDPKGRNFAKYAGATTISPNWHELTTALGMTTLDVDESEADIWHRTEELFQQLDLDFLTITRSEKGISLFDRRGIHHAPAMAREVFDVSGAGDTVVATLAASLAAGFTPVDAIRLANLAAGVVVAKVGTVPIKRHELQNIIDLQASGLFQMPHTDLLDTKIFKLDNLTEQVSRWRQKGERVVFTNGCFDILHAGHVVYLERASRIGDRLIVGLNTDDSVRRLKGSDRPINPQLDRAAMLASLASVDAVILFAEDTPINLLEALRPDVLAKGADYTENQVVGGDLVKSWGGEVHLVPLVEGRSSSTTIDKITQMKEMKEKNGQG